MFTYMLAPIEPALDMLRIRVMINDNSQSMDREIQQPLLRCEDLRAMFEMWMKENLRSGWAIGSDHVYFKEEREARKFQRRFGDHEKIITHVWREPSSLQSRIWVAFARDQFGNGFYLPSGNEYSAYSQYPYIGFGFSEPGPPMQSAFTWVERESIKAIL